MAEVLITLGVIGIVVAMTLPQLIKNYQHKVLETRFKKSVSLINQTVLFMKEELGEDRLAEFCTYLVYHSAEEPSYSNAKGCNDSFYKNINKIGGSKNAGENSKYNIDRSNEIFKTFNAKQSVTESALAGIGYPLYQTMILIDGSFVNSWIIEAQFYIGVDTNGQQGPNQLGHDIFVFTLNKKLDTLSFQDKPKNYTDEELENGDYEYEYQKERKGNPCSITSTQKGNGIGCAYYALRDECPDESGRKYFECLP